MFITVFLKPTTWSYPEPDQSNPHPHILYLELHFNIILLFKHRSSNWFLYIRFSHQKLHATCSPNSFSLYSPIAVLLSKIFLKTGKQVHLTLINTTQRCKVFYSCAVSQLNTLCLMFPFYNPVVACTLPCSACEQITGLRCYHYCCWTHYRYYTMRLVLKRHFITHW
jgi:hypothetical protein